MNLGGQLPGFVSRFIFRTKWTLFETPSQVACELACGTTRVNAGVHRCITRDGDSERKMNVHLAETPALLPMKGCGWGDMVGGRACLVLV
jgi:hypothetical protein